MFFNICQAFLDCDYSIAVKGKNLNSILIQVKFIIDFYIFNLSLNKLYYLLKLNYFKLFIEIEQIIFVLSLKIHKFVL